jgi:hypothetical protein
LLKLIFLLERQKRAKASGFDPEHQKAKVMGSKDTMGCQWCCLPVSDGWSWSSWSMDLKAVASALVKVSGGMFKHR